ncbi:hypothetical protein [Mesorhizobium sp. LSJC269B00]|uniref:hypothetical protein n=1 Tax=Mesorhizobium sp. LSJC269B00 TaxID=1287326 RepID=UPI0004191D33
MSNDAIQRKDRVRSEKTRRRLRETIGNIKKVKPRFGSALMAYAFYRSQALQGFSADGDALVRTGADRRPA